MVWGAVLGARNLFLLPTSVSSSLGRSKKESPTPALYNSAKSCKPFRNSMDVFSDKILSHIHSYGEDNYAENIYSKCSVSDIFLLSRIITTKNCRNNLLKIILNHEIDREDIVNIQNFKTTPTYLIQIDEHDWVGLYFYSFPGKKECKVLYIRNNDKTHKNISEALHKLNIKICDLLLPSFLKSWCFLLFIAKNITEWYALLKEESKFLEKIENFITEVTSLLKEINKIKGKFTYCSNLLEKLKQNNCIVCTHEHANLFLYFIDAFSLEDISPESDDLKHYIPEYVIGQNNMKLIKEIRECILKREETTVIYPHNLNRSIFSDNACEVFNFLSLFAKEILKYFNDTTFTEDKTDKDLSRYLKVPKLNENKMFQTFGYKLENKETFQLLKEISSALCEEILSSGKIQSPENIHFDYFFNFLPLIRNIHKGNIEFISPFFTKGFQILNDVHFLSIHENEKLPSVFFHRLLFDINKNIFAFSLGNEISSVINSNENESSLYTRLAESFKSANNLENKVPSVKKQELYYEENIENLVKVYLKTMPLLDASNVVTINCGENIVKKFNILNDEERTKIFYSFVFINHILKYEIKSFEIELIHSEIKTYLKQYFIIEESDLGRMSSSLKNEEFERKYEKLISRISSIVKKSLKSSPNFQYKIAEELLKPENNTIEIWDKPIVMSDKKIINNIFPVFRGIKEKSGNIYNNLEEAFLDELFLSYLFIDDEKVNRIYKASEKIPFLIPLLSILYTKQMFKPNRNNEEKFFDTCISYLLEPRKSIYLSKMISVEYKKNKVKILIGKILQEVIKNVFKIELKTLIPLFQIKIFEEYAMKEIKKFFDNKKFRSCHAHLGYKLVNFKYISAVKKFKEKDFINSLEMVEGKSGLSEILEILIKSKAIVKYSAFIAKIKIFTAKLKNKLGKHTESLQVLEEVLEMKGKTIFWYMRIHGLIGFTYSLKQDYEKSAEIYEKIIKKYKTMSKDLDTERAMFSLNSNLDSLLNSTEYKIAIKGDSYHLNIFKILNSFATQFILWGYQATDKKGKLQYFKKAAKEFKIAHFFQDKYLGKYNPLTVYSGRRYREATTRIHNLTK